MIKAIFEKEFLELSERIDNTLELTNYIIGSRYSSNKTIDNNFIKNLFNGSYVLSDTRQIGSYPLYSIWEKENNLLKICISIEEEEKENLVEPTNEYDFIYCYAKYPDQTEKIAIVLLSLEEDGITLSPLNLNISNNLLELKFPDKIISTIQNQMDSDTEFLEGIGIYSGVNIFNVPEKENSREEQLVSRDSYLKFIKNSLTGGTSISLLYNNTNGERVYNNSYRKIYKSITLSSLEPVDSLLPEGGYIRLLGTITYDTYKITNGYYEVLYSQNDTCDIINFPYIDIIVENNTGISITVWGEKKKIKYGENTSDGDLSAEIKLRIINVDGSVVESQPLTLTQKI